MSRTPSVPPELARRWSAALPFLIGGGVSIVAAGFTSAMSAMAPSYLAAWAVAYAVLVGGGCQLALGAGQAWLAPAVPSRGTVALQAALYNVGNAGIIAGQVYGTLVLTIAGSVLLVTALGLMYATLARVRHGGWLRVAYRVVIGILFVSIPVGLFIAGA